jgi:hypothetical protein
MRYGKNGPEGPPKKDEKEENTPFTDPTKVSNPITLEEVEKLVREMFKAWDEARPQEKNPNQGNNDKTNGGYFRGGGGGGRGQRRRYDNTGNDRNPGSEKDKNTNQSGNRVGTRCYGCGKTGHWRNNCPEKNKPHLMGLCETCEDKYRVLGNVICGACHFAVIYATTNNLVVKNTDREAPAIDHDGGNGQSA